MEKNQIAHRFFLGANTPTGFVHRADQLTDPKQVEHAFILKGAPGSGKSTLLKRIAACEAVRGRCPELISCSFDPLGLDAVLVGPVVIVDGTPPHALEPRYPGAVESIVSLGDCWDERELRARREEVICLGAEKKRLCEQSRRYLAAADALLSDNYRLVLDATDAAKVERLAQRIAAQEFPGREKGEGSERVRLLSAMTARGDVLYDGTARALASRIYLIQDEFGPSSGLLLSALRRYALSAGCDIISCFHPMAPHERLEHLFIPALSLGFMTMDDRLLPDVNPYRVVHYRRFTDKAALSECKRRITFNRKAARQLLDQAQVLMAEALQAHVRLEGIYTSAMDFSAVDALTEALEKRIGDYLK